MHKNFSLDLAPLPKELKVIIEMMKIDSDKRLISIREELFTGIDWDRFIQLVIHHRVYPTIYTRIRELGEEFVPIHVFQSLRKAYKSNTFQMLHLSGEMEQVSQLFTESQIPLLFLKGPVLAADLYGDISLRTSSDLDILIPVHDLDRAEELLSKHGYIKEDLPSLLNDWKWRHHHLTYFHPQKRIKIEIHWRLNPGPAKEPGFERLWKGRRVSTITHYPVYLLGREDLFIFLVTHGARHGWSRLRWLADIDNLVRKNLNWTELVYLLKKYEHLHLGGQSLILAAQLLNTPINEEIERLTQGNRAIRLAQDTIFYFEKMISLHSLPLPEDVSRYHKRYLFSLKSIRQKLYFIISFLHPYPMDAEILRLPRALHLLYFPLRPFLWVWRKTKEHSLS